MIWLIASVCITLSLIVILRRRYRCTAHSPEEAIEETLSHFPRNITEATTLLSYQHEGRPHYAAFGGPSNEAVPPGQWIFQIGSLSKVFTSCLLQQLHQQQRLNMHATLPECLKQLGGLHPKLTNTTLYELACHRSGLPRVPRSMMKKLKQRSDKKTLMENPYSHLNMDDLLAWLARPDDMRSSGKFRYSNLGVGLLGHVLEQITGESLEDLLQTELCQPLGLTRTSFNLARLPADAKVTGLNAKGKATLDWEFPILEGAGGLYSCGDDLHRLLQTALNTDAPEHERLKHTLKPHKSGKTALGWLLPTPLDKLLGQGKVRWHDGMVGGFSACMMLDPSSQLSVISLRNQAVDNHIGTAMLMRKLRRHFPAAMI